ncbi:MAG: DUF2855 family protein [Pseudomonadota bacterium]|nr:DUF2855 family protein [Pseudomonadota bacterium]
MSLIKEELQTSKINLTERRIVTTDFNLDDLNEGEIIVEIESFAFTSNNVTYGVAGEMMGYWKFFPSTKDPENIWGCIPMWGFAKIKHSNNEELKTGERLFGYFPASNILVMKPIKVSQKTFIDGQDHRKDLPPVYNNYIRLNNEDSYNKDNDNLRALLFPLHITSFCLCDYLQYEDYLGAEQIIIVSASSKTAIGLAQGLHREKGRPEIVGLTSKRNLDFVKDLNSYDHVITYDELDNINIDSPAVMVDMAGNREILGKLHSSLGNKMIKCITVGMTHWDNETTADDTMGQLMNRERTEFFFAPDHIQKRINDWGTEGYNQKTSSFMDTRAEQSKSWMNIKEVSGLDNFLSTYDNVIQGDINPNEGIIVNIKSIP